MLARWYESRDFGMKDRNQSGKYVSALSVFRFIHEDKTYTSSDKGKNGFHQISSAFLMFTSGH